MKWLRHTLDRLSWPVDSLSDEEITRELCRRWFATGAESAPSEENPSTAAATGVFVTMAREGNLDALCWNDTGGAVSDDLPAADWDPFERKSDKGGGVPGEEPPRPERRSSPRVPTSDFIDFASDNSTNHSSGWLVDASTEGIAFIAETKDVPAVGARITATVRRRDGETTRLGFATAVRTELLSELLSLVCARLEISREPEE